jgi:hypothetical protein
MALSYTVTTTGDCANNFSGVISLLVTGGTAPYIIDWVNPLLPQNIQYALPVVKAGLSGGDYLITVTDSDIPSPQTSTISIPISTGVCASISGVQNTTCSLNNGSVTGTSSTIYSSADYYLYHGNGVFSQSATTNQPTVQFGNLTAGTYYMTVMDLGGCTANTQNFIVEESTPLDYGLYVVPNSACGGTPIGKITITGITGQSPFTYLWSNGATGTTITGLTSGGYSVTVTDNNGCLVSKGATIVDVQPVGLGIITATPPSCFASDGVINLTITGGTAPYYYSANTGAVEVSYSKTFTITGLSSGSYTFLVTDAGLCQMTAGTQIVSPNGISSVSVTSNNSTCSSINGSIGVSVIGGVTPYTYTLVSSAGTSSISSSFSAQIFSGLSTGDYSVAVSDNSGCYYMQDVTIIAENKYTISTQVTGTTCGQSNGSVTIFTTTGSTLPLDYSIDNGVYDIIDTTLTSVTFNNLTAGNHVVTVSDANDCIQTTNILILGSVPLDFSLYSTSCGTGSSGKITAFINQGETPFSFNWSDNVPNNPQQIQVSGLTGGTYSLTIVGSDGCSLARTTTISCNASLTSYQTYVMGSEVFNIASPTKFGILQMLNEGYYDLTLDNTGCDFISATFTAKVSVSPLGLTTSDTFYTTTSLVNVPADNLYYDTITQLLLSVPGVGSVVVNPTDNLITIETTRGNNTLQGQEIVIDLIIVYDIMCLT